MKSLLFVLASACLPYGFVQAMDNSSDICQQRTQRCRALTDASLSFMSAGALVAFGCYSQLAVSGGPYMTALPVACAATYGILRGVKATKVAWRGSYVTNDVEKI